MNTDDDRFTDWESFVAYAKNNKVTVANVSHKGSMELRGEVNTCLFDGHTTAHQYIYIYSMYYIYIQSVCYICRHICI